MRSTAQPQIPEQAAQRSQSDYQNNERSERSQSATQNNERSERSQSQRQNNEKSGSTQSQRQNQSSRLNQKQRRQVPRNQFFSDVQAEPYDPAVILFNFRIMMD
jgi:hypothetical protein